MPHGLQLPLARPIVLQGDPPCTIDTFLAAVEFLASSEGPRSPEVEATIDHAHRRRAERRALGRRRRN